MKELSTTGKMFITFPQNRTSEDLNCSSPNHYFKPYILGKLSVKALIIDVGRQVTTAAVFLKNGGDRKHKRRRKHLKGPCECVEVRQGAPVGLRRWGVDVRCSIKPCEDSVINPLKMSDCR